MGDVQILERKKKIAKFSVYSLICCQENIFSLLVQKLTNTKCSSTSYWTKKKKLKRKKKKTDNWNPYISD